MSLFKTNLKVTWRRLKSNWGSSLLNVFGLMLGVLCSIIIFLTLQYEFSFDQHHDNHREIYRVTNNYYYPTFTMHTGHTPDIMGEALKNDFPEFKQVVSIHSSFNHNISVGNQIFEADLLYCDPAFIQTFSFYNQPSQWLIGDPNDILKETNKTILTQSLAENLFGEIDAAIGKIITLENEAEVEVAGIVKDPPKNTSYPFEQLVSYATFDRFTQKTFSSVSSTTTFVQIPAAVNVKDLRPAIDQFNKKYMEAAWGEDFVSMDLQALSAIHFDERFASNNYTTNKTYLWILGLIGLFMILIACINFVNLATAKAMSRSKEIGMRKILGSSEKSIVSQFISESFVLALTSIYLGFMLARLSFPYFSQLTQLNIGNDFSLTSDLVLFIIGLLFFITLAIGLYPALVLSKFQPLEVVQQKNAFAPIKGLTLRRSLIAFQLTVSQIMVIAVIVIGYQLDFFQSKDLGFEKESVLVVDIHGDESSQKMSVFKNQIQQLPFVKQAALSSGVPMSGHHNSTALTSVDSEIKERFNVFFIYADNDYTDAMSFELLAGKSSVIDIQEDTIQGFVVNETLVNRLAFGSAEAAIGKRISVRGYEAKIIGVVKDFHTMSLHEKIRPVALIYGIDDFSTLGIKYQSNDIGDALAQIETAWQSVFPNKNFDYFFQDQQMGEMYDNEIRFSKIIKAFTLICILIACIGLIGLSAFSSVKRFKEIGIRKVLGASIPNILFLMTKEFAWLIVISFFISIPFAYYLISAWLEDFAYHINMEWWMIAVAGGLVLLLTLLTISLQSLKAACINPINSLRGD
ncbi:MAG: ABC transporter permease [Bacteroidota bacterium]